MLEQHRKTSIIDWVLIDVRSADNKQNFWRVWKVYVWLNLFVFYFFYRNSSINILISDSNICSSTSPLILGNIHFLINTISETSRLSLSANHDRLEFYKIIENFKFFVFFFSSQPLTVEHWSGVECIVEREERILLNSHYVVVESW